MTDDLEISQAVENFNSLGSALHDSARSSNENHGPHLLVFDDFYDDPLAIRNGALASEFAQYSPPLISQVGEEIANEPRYSNVSGNWQSTVVKTFRGFTVRSPFLGHRHAPESLREYLEELLNEKIPREGWLPGGDDCNGAFHLRESGNSSIGAVHHHYYENNTSTTGWSGVCYLSPEPTKNSGTSFWMNNESRKVVAQFGETYDMDLENYECVLMVPNLFNRLVLFRENVLHRAGNGFGEGKKARLTQTFFFDTARQ